MPAKSLNKLTKNQLIEIITQLQQSEEKYKSLLDSSSDPIFAFGPDGSYLYVNQAFASGVGRDRDEIINHKIWDVFSQEEANHRYSAVKWVFEHGETKIIEVRVPRPDGDHFYLTTVKPVMDENGSTLSVICISKDITERKGMEEQLLNLSTKDILTGLFNRNFFEVEMDRIQVSRMFPVSIVVADMDNLKGINDRFGHTKGDEILRMVADCCKQSFRAEDIVARIGGDEFGVILPFTDHEAASEAVERLRSNLDALNNPLVSLSMGMATSGLEEELQRIIKRADDLMYREKMAHRIAKRY